MGLSEKKKEEMKYAQIFLKFFDTKNRCNYTTIPNENEALQNPEVDVYATSKTCEHLKLQIKIIDKGYMPSFIQRVKEAEQSPNGYSSMHCRNIDPVKWAKQTIKECAERYEPSVRKEIILILGVYFGGELNQEYARKEFAEYQSSDFKGIYLIDPPSTTTNYAGQMTTIKKIRLGSLV